MRRAAAPRTGCTRASGATRNRSGGAPPGKVRAGAGAARERRAYLKLLRAEDIAIATQVDLAEDFLVMLRRREGERLPAWLDAVEAGDIDELKRFAAADSARTRMPSRPG